MHQKIRSHKTAPMILLGAIFLFASCKEKSTTSWEKPEATEATEIDQDRTASQTAAQKSAQLTTPHTEKAPAEPTTPTDLRFLSYNIKNYLRMNRWIDDVKTENAPKPEEEIQALIKLIVDQKPDILGLCEIGTKEELADLQARLKKAGLDLPESEYAYGWDNTRRLALLSKYPITERNSQSELFYKLGDSDMQISRGLLHVTIDLPIGSTHFIGAHLKSKRELPNHSQELMRQNEALLIRKHCNKILNADENARIIVYGDMNDTRRTPAITNIKGRRHSSNYLEDILVTDSRGEIWTHMWQYQHVYSRFDYIFVSKSVKPFIDQSRSYIIDAPEWELASDHRAIMLIIGQQ